MARVVRRWGPLLLGGGAAAGLGYALSRRRAFPVQVDPTLPLPTLGLPSRQQQLERVTAASQASEEYDVIVIGGGATGAGVALDSATRGLKTLLLEASDFSSGTSSRSTKLIHGGVRYLQLAVEQLDWQQFLLVREALHERENLMYIGPHLSSSLPILLPIYTWWEVPWCWLGLKVYDLIAWSQALGKCYFVGKDRALQMYPLLNETGLRGAMVYCDGLHNDSRMNVSIVLTAVQHGATALNYVKAESLLKDAMGKVVGVVAQEQLDPGSKPLYLRSKMVVNATGAYCDAVLQMDQPSHKTLVQPSSGVHITLPDIYTTPGLGVLSTTQDGRVLFLLPWEGQTIAGTTDNKCDLVAEPAATASEVKFILREMSKYLQPGIDIPSSDVKSAWSGIRPLVLDPSKDTKHITRSHLVVPNATGGLVTITGGKWTTYRQMAEDTLDACVRHAKGRLGHAAPCRTRRMMLMGGHSFSPLVPIQLVQKYHVTHALAKHLSHSYGDQAFAVADLAQRSGFRKLCPNSPHEFLEAEVEYVTHEYASTASDVLARRTRLAFLDHEAAVKACPRIVELMGDHLGWSRARRAAELRTTLAFLETFRPPTAEQLAAAA